MNSKKVESLIDQIDHKFEYTHDFLHELGLQEDNVNSITGTAPKTYNLAMPLELSGPLDHLANFEQCIQQLQQSYIKFFEKILELIHSFQERQT